MTRFHSGLSTTTTTTRTLSAVLLLSTLIQVHASELDWESLWSRNSDSSESRSVPDAGFYNPLDAGGSFLTKIPETFPMGQGEPLNAIISGHSDEDVLVDSELDGGLRNYFFSLGFSGGCLGQIAGSNQGANLGDGDGYQNQTEVMRWNYGDAEIGSCKETIEGGNHFRFWTQDGPEGNSGAVFLAVSYELPLSLHHDIIANGYNLGRDQLIGNITRSEIPTSKLTDQSTYSGTTSFGGYTYSSDIKYVSGLLANTSDGINHNITVGIDGINAVDGLVAVLTVRITDSPEEERRGGALGWTSYSSRNLFVGLTLTTLLPALLFSWL